METWHAAAAVSAPDGMTLLAITDTILTANPSLYFRAVPSG
jgi:hypothetical protein